jgi:hypothetical protein
MCSFICGNSRPTQSRIPIPTMSEDTTKAATNGSKTKRNMEVHLNSSTTRRPTPERGGVAAPFALHRSTEESKIHQ